MSLNKRIEKLESNTKPARIGWNLSTAPTEDLITLRDLLRTDRVAAKAMQDRLSDDGVIFAEVVT
jgi:hypothetical protein